VGGVQVGGDRRGPEGGGRGTLFNEQPDGTYFHCLPKALSEFPLVYSDKPAGNMKQNSGRKSPAPQERQHNDHIPTFS